MPSSRVLGRAPIVKSVPQAWRVSITTLLLGAGVAAADPDPAVSSDPAPSAPVRTAPSISPLIFVDVPPPPPPPSLRIEAARVAAERFGDTWRYPEPGPLFTSDGGLWSFGAYYYRPRTAKSAALHGGSVAASIAGEILMSAGSPLAGVGAFLAGATMDAAAADVDRAAERSRR
jgi:hypothetical protein